jgi:phosphatidylserine/phosphatidylglycerophosphate/cardiolipin synthase-like enzyme/uncharacterized membrane protein YdjX (TVP38/TMEM64 family)
LRLLVDGDDFFRAVRQAIINARHSLFIVGWDIDSELRLMPGGAADGYPEPLSALLHATAVANPRLRIYILSWDFSMLYAMEREWRPVFKLGWQPHRRIVFGLDGHHPLGGAHHQKIIVVDDALAFVGGMDLTRARWDTSDHMPDSPLRQDSHGTRYAPLHDVQAMFDGSAARAMGRLVRERWRRATGRSVNKRRRVAGVTADPWPTSFAPDVTDVRLGIARTEPAHAGRAGVQEILQFHLDAIAAAKRSIYIESQYFTSHLVGQALVDRLNGGDAPETVVVSRRAGSGWLEESNISVLRARLHKRLQQADSQDRYRLYSAGGPGLAETGLNIHSKLTVFDDELLCIGSANLSNRSMALDSECSIILEAGGVPRVRQAIAAMRTRLLAEHLECDTAVLEQATREGLIAGVESLRGEARTLTLLDPGVDAALDAKISVLAQALPEQPIEPDALVRQFVPVERLESRRGRYIAVSLFALFFMALTVVWTWTPLADYLQFNALTQLAQGFNKLPFTWLVVMAGYVLAGLFSIPITILIVVTGVVFGATTGGLYALAGTLLSALVTYGAGRWLGRETVRRLAGTRINNMSRRLARRGLIAMIILRLLPVAPFTIVNVIAGASQISLRDYMLGTLLGMGPGIIVTVVFAHHLASAMRNPSPQSFVLVAAVAVVFVLVSMLVHRIFLARDKRAGKLKSA